MNCALDLFDEIREPPPGKLLEQHQRVRAAIAAMEERLRESREECRCLRERLDEAERALATFRTAVTEPGL